MKLNLFPLCCGARILVGLHNPPVIGNGYTDLMMNRILLGQYLSDRSSINNYFFPERASDWHGPTNKIFSQRPWESQGVLMNHGTSHDLIFPYVPETLLLFQQVLRKISNLDYYQSHRKDATHVGIGTIIAITAPGETMSVPYLKATGFKQTISTDKSTPGQKRCMTWVGDWWEIVEILKKVSPYDFTNGKQQTVETRFR